MRWLLALALLVACERDQPAPTPAPAPAPAPPGPKPLDLSTPRPNPVDPLDETVRVSVSPTGLFVNGSHVLALDASTTERAIVDALVKALPKPNPNMKAIIDADKKLAYGTVIAVIDAVKQVGYTKLAIGTVAP
jgi:biopolymer transport protein ExbD